jgi:hypothetical protein
MTNLILLIDTASLPWPTEHRLAAGSFRGRAARGSVAPRKMACRPAVGSLLSISRFKAIDSRERGAA